MNLKQAPKIVANAEEEIDAYIVSHSDAEPEWAARTYRETHLQVVNPRMASGHLQGRILKMLVRMARPKRILEIGTFTGYASLCMAEGLDADGHLDTLEINDELEEFILTQFQNSPFNDKITLHIGDAIEIIQQLDHTYDFVFIDADKRLYEQYFELILPKVPPGGFILIDNTLWDGKVLLEHPLPTDHQTIAIKAFNNAIAQDERIEKVILPLRDGLTIVRKR